MPKLEDEPILANGTPSESRIDAFNGKTNILWQMDLPGNRSECLEYQYAKIGRRTYFGQCIYKKTFSEARVNLEVCSYLADEPSLADGAPINRA